MLNLNSGGNSYRQLVGASVSQKVNTSKLNTNDKQESKDKAYPK